MPYPPKPKTTPKPVSNSQTSAPSVIQFPTEMSPTSPYIMFKTRLPKDEGNTPLSIVLPLPPGIISVQTGEYGETSMSSGEGRSGAAAAIMASDNKMATIGGILLDKITSRAGLSEDTKDKISLGAKSIKNPNMNATFKGNSARSYSYSFTLIPKSAKDSEAMRAIWSTFQRLTYAGSSSYAGTVILSYPPVWNIYYCSNMGEETDFIPKAWACYLTSFTYTGNPDTNIFHRDGSPQGITIALEFKESRTLTRTDIDALQAGSGTRGVGSDGTAST